MFKKKDDVNSESEEDKEENLDNETADNGSNESESSEDSGVSKEYEEYNEKESMDVEKNKNEKEKTDEADNNHTETDKDKVKDFEKEKLIKCVKDENKKLKDKVSKIQSENAKFKNEIDTLKDRFSRTVAEYDNFRKRTAREKEKIYTDVCEDVLKEVLPVLDNLERAISVEGNTEDLKKGVEMTMKQFKNALKKLNVEEIPTDGQFDPHLHNAVMHVEDDNYGKNSIVEVFQKGYKKGDKVIRYSMVKVAN